MHIVHGVVFEQSSTQQKCSIATFKLRDSASKKLQVGKSIRHGEVSLRDAAARNEVPKEPKLALKRLPSRWPWRPKSSLHWPCSMRLPWRAVVSKGSPAVPLPSSASSGGTVAGCRRRSTRSRRCRSRRPRRGRGLVAARGAAPGVVAGSRTRSAGARRCRVSSWRSAWWPTAPRPCRRAPIHAESLSI